MVMTLQRAWCLAFLLPALALSAPSDYIGLVDSTDGAPVELDDGSDVAADLEEESHCAEHDSDDVNCSGETITVVDDGHSHTGATVTGVGASTERLTYSSTVANTLTVGTDTGVTETNTTLQFASTGDILGAVNVSSKTAADYTIGTDDAHEAYGTLFINGDNDLIEFSMPSAVAGMSACFMQGQGSSGVISVEQASGDYFVSDGVRTDADAQWVSDGAGEDKLCLIAVDATDWVITTQSGTWTEQ